MRRGFWFNHETGEFKDAIFNSHLSCVIADPVRFGVTTDFILSQFEAAESKDSMGRDARHRILLAVLERSTWTRWREITPPLYSRRWTVEAWSTKRWNPTEEDLMRTVGEWVDDGGSGSERFDVILTEDLGEQETTAFYSAAKKNSTHPPSL